MPSAGTSGYHSGIMDHRAIDRIQERAIRESVAALERQRSVLLEAPTGAGKTRISARIAEAMAGKTLVLTHRDALTRQAHEAWKRWTPGHSSTLAIDGEMNQAGEHVFATVQTASARLKELERYDLLVIDEAHHAADSAQGSNQYSRVIDALHRLNPQMRVLAATATPSRPDGKGLHRSITSGHHVAIGLRELEQAGQIRVPMTRQLNILAENGLSLRQTAARFFDPMTSSNHDGVNKALRTHRPPDFHAQVASQWARYAGHLQTIAFEDRIEDAQAFARELQAMGIRAAVVDSSRPPSENQAAIKAYSRGDLQLLSSVGMIDEGLDIPSTRCTLILKGTSSAIQYAQMCGRAMRAHGADTTPIVLDAGMSTAIHGAIESRAAVQEYFRKLEERRLAAERMQHDTYLPHRTSQDGYTPWKLISRQPPMIAMTNGHTTSFARIMRMPDGQIGFMMGHTARDRNGERLQLYRHPGNQRIAPIGIHDFEQLEGAQTLPHRHHISRLAATRVGDQSCEISLIRAAAARHHASFAQMTAIAHSQGAGR